MAGQLEKTVVSDQPEFEYLQKWLANRQFEGPRTGRGFLTLDEYCSLIRFYQNWRRDADESILRYIAVSFSGRALTWWSNNVNKITTLKELEEQLRLRFDQETYISANIDLFKRKQRSDEPLLDFIDEKLFIMQRIQANMPDQRLSFDTMEEFTRFAASLVRTPRSNDG